MQRRMRDSGARLKARCEQNPSSPIPATMFHLHSPGGVTGFAQPYWIEIAHFPTRHA